MLVSLAATRPILTRFSLMFEARVTDGIPSHRLAALAVPLARVVVLVSDRTVCAATLPVVATEVVASVDVGRLVVTVIDVHLAIHLGHEPPVRRTLHG